LANFIGESLGLRHTDDVELKWGVHKAGEAREEWVKGEMAYRSLPYLLILW